MCATVTRGPTRVAARAMSATTSTLSVEVISGVHCSGVVDAAESRVSTGASIVRPPATAA
jgi:hypothetical protein